MSNEPKRFSTKAKILIGIGYIAGILLISWLIGQIRPEFLRRIKGEDFLIEWDSLSFVAILFACIISRVLVGRYVRSHYEDLRGLTISNPDYMHMIRFSQFHVCGYWLLRMMLYGVAEYFLEELPGDEKTSYLPKIKLKDAFLRELTGDPDVKSRPNILLPYFLSRPDDQRDTPAVMKDVICSTNKPHTYSSPMGQYLKEHENLIPVSSVVVLLVPIALSLIAILSKIQLGIYYHKPVSDAVNWLCVVGVILLIFVPLFIISLYTKAQSLWRDHVRKLLEKDTPVPTTEELEKIGLPDHPFSEEDRIRILRAYCVHFDKLSKDYASLQDPCFFRRLLVLVYNSYDEYRKQQQANSGSGCTGCSSCGGCGGGCGGCGGCGD